MNLRTIPEDENTMDKKFEKEILENLDELGEKLKKNDKVNGKKEALDAYKKAGKLLK